MPPRIVILGGGFAGAYCAQALAKKARRGVGGCDVWLIDRRNYFTFTPLLIEAGTGNLEPRHVIVPIRDFLRTGTFRMADIEDVDVRERRVRYRPIGADEPQEITCDHLVLALGSVTRMPDVPGVREHCWQMKGLSDAVALRDRAIQLLELADATTDPEEHRALLHFVIIGANFTGVEVAGEFDELLKHASRRYPNVMASDCRVTLIELADQILAPLGPELGAFAKRHLEKRGIVVRVNMTAQRVEADRVILADDTVLHTRTCIWCAGIAPSPLIESIDVPTDERGYILCERELRVKGFENVWAIGDCAVNINADGQPYPATAQHAVREGAHLAQNLLSIIRGGEASACDLIDQGTLAAIGCRTGVAKVFGIKLSGFAAWWLWRTVYLLKMPRLGRKVRVALDWTIDLFFRRDYVQLGVHRREEYSPRRAAEGHGGEDSRNESQEAQEEGVEVGV